MMYIQDFVVEPVAADSPFPLDMLRYDRCWPATSQDAVALLRDPARATRVHLRRWISAPDVVPTERWRSFGWRTNVTSTRKKP
jgi:hypothetical protein